jgi:hypothetical protein
MDPKSVRFSSSGGLCESSLITRTLAVRACRSRILGDWTMQLTMRIGRDGYVAVTFGTVADTKRRTGSSSARRGCTVGCTGDAAGLERIGDLRRCR